MLDNNQPHETFRAAVRAALGGVPERIHPGRMHRFSLNGKPGDTAGWCLLFADGRAGVYGDFRAAASAVWVATRGRILSRAAQAEHARAVSAMVAERKRWREAEWDAQAPTVRRLWEKCTPSRGGGAADPLALYLRRRLVLQPAESLHIPDALRLHRLMPYFHDGHTVGAWPAMVAAFSSAAGDLVTLHRTWITSDGRKAPTPGPVKKLMQACGPVMGGCIRLVTTAEWHGEVLGIAEGIETALAARCASTLPTVAAYSAGGMAAWAWPRTLRRMVIFADNDPAGAKAAAELARRARSTRWLDVQLLTPTAAGSDWCDVWAHREGASHER